jgi:hypothetical protein
MSQEPLLSGTVRSKEGILTWGFPASTMGGAESGT